MKVIVNHKGSGEVENMKYPYFAYHNEYPKDIWLLGSDCAVVVVSSGNGNSAGECWYDYPKDRFIPLPANSMLTLQNEVRPITKKLRLG